MGYWSEMWTQLKGFNRNIHLFLLSNAFFQIGFGMFMIVYNLYVKSLGYSETVNGQIISFTSLATALLLIPAGMISDKVGRKNILIYGGLAVALVAFGRSVAEDHTALLFLAWAGGFAAAFIQVAVAPFLAEYSVPEQRVHLFTYNFSFMMAANVIGNMGGGLLADGFALWFGSEVTGLKLTLAVSAVFTLMAVIPILKVEKNDKHQPKRIPFHRLFIEQRDQLAIIGKFAGAAAFIGFGAGLVIPYLNLYFHDRFGASSSAIGFVISLGQGATALAMLIGPAIVTRMGEVKAVVFLQMMSIPFLLLTGLTNSFALASIGFLFRQALMNAGNPIQQSLMMSKVNDEMKGLANSVGQMVFMLGWALMGPISTAIVTRGGTYWGYATVFALTAILYFCGSLFFYRMFGRDEKEELEKQASPARLGAAPAQAPTPSVTEKG
jgi:MFS family permease